MATTPPVIQTKITTDMVKLPVMSLLVTVILGVVFANSVVGGVIYYLLRSGKVSVRSIEAPPIPVTTPLKTHMIALEPMLVNLSDNSGNAYLRAGLTLQVAESAGSGSKEAKGTEAKSGDKSADAAIRDTTLTILGRETSERLLSPGGKERLKEDLKAAFTKHDPDIKVVDLFFTDFLVQR